MRLLTISMAIFALALTGCAALDGGDEGDSGGAPEKQVDERGMRPDLEPLTSRFPALGHPVSAQWQSGTLGDADVPGPTSYWIDGVVTLAPEVADQLRAEHDPVAGDQSPDVVDAVGDVIPEGSLTRSDSLDGALSQGEWAVHGWLVEGQDVLVLEAKGQ